MYTGLKSLSSEEPSILTRSAFSGIQRYGVVTWSGDVGNDFGTLKREIAGGLGQMATGLPWWTFDAGGFFRPSDQYQSEEYQERMLRWIQVGCFLPFMRVHGYMSRTEPWRYSEKTQEIFVKYINLRKSLQPYIIDRAGPSRSRPCVSAVRLQGRPGSPRTGERVYVRTQVSGLPCSGSRGHNLESISSQE